MKMALLSFVPLGNLGNLGKGDAAHFAAGGPGGTIDVNLRQAGPTIDEKHANRGYPCQSVVSVATIDALSASILDETALS
ncbi:MAG: hypothetical protein L0387_22200 [Acidobacteria bacterium]|nr:hypothetical protein [Acidobacteriota bacterium]MCI0721622.1 hypothetical protein [Acidobacteriota bacterium]